MKITKVDIFEFIAENKPFFRVIGCRIYTDEGIYGDGEAALSYGVGASAAFGMLKDLAKLIIGMDPLETEPIWHKFHRSTFWGQAGGPVVFAGISGIDIALWDIKGKFYGQPIWKLLGGKFRNDLRCYASQIHQGFGPEHENRHTVEQLVDISKKVVAEGYDALKIDFMCFNETGAPYTYEDRKCLLTPHHLGTFKERLAAVREAVGPSVDIIIENHSNLDALSAIQVARMAEPYNILYFEEPNTPSVKTSKYICENINMPLANGERIFSRWQYMPYFENMCLQVAQPDIGTCGGFSEAKKICDIANVYDVAIQAHACGSPISSTAALHLEAAIPNFIIHEHHLCFLHPYNKAFCINDYQPVNGRMAIPNLPGLGNEWTEDAMAKAIKTTVQ